METRFEKGLSLSKSIFSGAIEAMHARAPKNQLPFQRSLSANCFGDYDTRTGLDSKTRELLTFAMLLSLGGCEPQRKGHIQSNGNVDNDKAKRLDVVAQILPYIGDPRILNARHCLKGRLATTPISCMAYAESAPRHEKKHVPVVA